VGEGRRLAGHAAQTESGMARIIGGLEAAVIEAEALGRLILEIKLAIIATAERQGSKPLRGIGVERVAVNEAAGI
jgi:hypothetical protein